MMILVNGGSSSGKSAFAESLILEQDKRERAEENKTCPSWYLATMIAWDEECRERIRKHRNMRAEKNFRTIECPVDLETAEIPAGSRCLLECVSNLAANEMYRGDMKNPAEHAKERILAGIEKVRKKSGFFVIVTNDVSGDQGAYSEETEEYRNLLGEINIALAGEADEVYEVLCGIPVKIKTAEKNTAQREDKEKAYDRRDHADHRGSASGESGICHEKGSGEQRRPLYLCGRRRKNAICRCVQRGGDLKSSYVYKKNDHGSGRVGTADGISGWK